MINKTSESLLWAYTGFVISHISQEPQHVGLSIILDTIIKKFDRRKPFEGTHRTVVCST